MPGCVSTDHSKSVRLHICQLLSSYLSTRVQQGLVTLPVMERNCKQNSKALASGGNVNEKPQHQRCQSFLQSRQGPRRKQPELSSDRFSWHLKVLFQRTFPKTTPSKNSLNSSAATSHWLLRKLNQCVLTHK